MDTQTSTKTKNKHQIKTQHTTNNEYITQKNLPSPPKHFKTHTQYPLFYTNIT